MTWVLVDSDGNESEPIESEAEAQDQKRSMEQLDVSVELVEVESGRTVGDNNFEAGDIDAEIIEVSAPHGGDSADDDDEELEIVGDGGRPYVYCDNCNRLSTCTYRCPDDRCGADLAGKPFYRGGDQ